MPLPDYIFKNRYEFNYLLLESEINSKLFSSNLQLFTSELGLKNFDIRLSIPPENLIAKTELFYSIPSKSCNSLFDFYNLEYEINREKVFLFLFDYFINDATKEWECFSSYSCEVAIFSCNSNVNDSFKRIFKPYANISLNSKLEDIVERFNSISEKKTFLKILEDNYSFASYL